MIVPLGEQDSEHTLPHTEATGMFVGGGSLSLALIGCHAAPYRATVLHIELTNTFSVNVMLINGFECL